ncbi:MAG: alpha-glucosidase [Acholeplasmataceae bacterium]|nr:MAG: alpha-glucosidase [Acholeplasmataceae bacterium]
MFEDHHLIIKGREDIRINMADLSLFVGNGRATYRMRRGSFSTGDKIKEIRRLFFKERQQDTFIYANDAYEVTLKVTTDDPVHIDVTCNMPMNRFWLVLPSTEDERFYGCGEQFTHLDLKNKKVKVWVSEHHSLKTFIKKFLFEKLFGVRPGHLGPYREHQTYHAQPTFMSSKGYVVHVDSEAFGFFQFKKEETMIHFRDVPKRMSILADQDMGRLAMKVSDLVGRQQPLPDWTGTGAIIATQGGLDQAIRKLKTAKEHGIKVVGIWCQDWSGQLKTAFGSQVYWNWQVDETLYPKLKEAIARMREEGIRFLGYINTFLKEDVPLYNEARRQGYLVTDKQGEPYRIQSTTFNAGIVDLSHPKAYDWYKQLIITHMIDLGMSGWMADFGEYLPTDACIHGGDAEAWHNHWPVLWARLNQEAIRDTGKENEIFFFNRAGHTGTISHANLMWAGDQHVDFSDAYGLPSVITATLSMATIGVGQMHSDIGGYTAILHMKRSPELFMRWAEMNVFTPLFRCHEGSRPEDNCQFDHSPEVLKHFAAMTHLYISLRPYMEACKQAYQDQGIPINRPLFFHSDESFAWTEKRMFMLGQDLLVAPAYRPGQHALEVTLPQGDWARLLSHEIYRGGTHVVDVPLGKPAAFYRRNSPFAKLFESITIT